MYRAPWKRIDERVLQPIFVQYGIKEWEKWDFSQFNLVTGENGMGKSRLLKAIRDICRDSQIPCIYMNFAQLGEGRKQSQEQDGADLANVLLYHGELSDNAYGNFMAFLEENAKGFSVFLNEMSSRDAEMVMGERRKEINQFLKEQLGREIIFDRNLSECKITSREKSRQPLSFADAVSEMSPGEKSIMYFALGILCTEADSKTNGEFVLLLDEPEAHLHPKALMSLIKALKNLEKVKRNGHVLIASHSIFLLPLFRYEELLLVSMGKICRLGASLYSEIYQALVGSPGAEGGGLQELLSSISHWNFNNFLTECLCEPTVSDKVKREDPQFKKLIKALEPLMKEGKSLKLLDYGGGSGRIAKCMQLYFADTPNNPLIERLIYDVYDPYLDQDEMPRAAWMGHGYAKEDRDKLLPKAYDLIVLYNVLHEIDVTEWANTLNGILELLNDDGILVFGERMVLSQGERPYGKSGYLVLERSELLLLFGVDHVEVISAEEGQPDDKSDSGKSDATKVKKDVASTLKDPTKCYTITSPREITVTEINVFNALKSLAERSKRKIEQYINAGTQANKSREYAFYCQQYINAKHAAGLIDESKDLEVQSLKLAVILHYYPEADQRGLIEKRAKYSDEEGQKCKNWLLMNPQD